MSSVWPAKPSKPHHPIQRYSRTSMVGSTISTGHRLAGAAPGRLTFGGLRDRVGGRLQFLHDVGPGPDAAFDDRAQPPAGSRQAADSRRGLVRQLVDERARQAQHAHDDQHRGQRARKAPAREPLDDRVEGVADQHANQHRDDQRPSEVQSDQHGERRDDLDGEGRGARAGRRFGHGNGELKRKGDAASARRHPRWTIRRWDTASCRTSRCRSRSRPSAALSRVRSNASRPRSTASRPRDTSWLTPSLALP